MTEFKPIKNLDELKNVQVGEIIGIWRLASSSAIVASCEENNGEKMKLLGKFKWGKVEPINGGEIISEYSFLINNIKKFCNNGSIIINFQENPVQYFEPKDEGYDIRKQVLIERGLWA